MVNVPTYQQDWRFIYRFNGFINLVQRFQIEVLEQTQVKLHTH